MAQFYDSVLNKCDVCCVPPEVNVTCVSRTTTGATLEGFEPCGGDAPGTCVRYRRWESGGDITQTAVAGGQPPYPEGYYCAYECGQQYPAYGGRRTIETSFSVTCNYGEDPVGSATNDYTWCQGGQFSSFSYPPGTGYGDGSYSETITNPTYLQNFYCIQSETVTTECSFGSGTNTWSSGTSVVAATFGFFDADTWEAARLRTTGTTGTSCCASLGTPVSPCQEGTAVQVTMVIWFTGTPTTVYLVRVTFSDSSTMDVVAETDIDGEWADEILIPDPIPGSSRCFVSAVVVGS